MPTAMTAEKCYVDSSALRQLYVHDAHSVAMATWRFKNHEPLSLTRFGRAELINSIASAVFRRDIPETAFQSFVQELAADFLEGRLQLVDVPWRAVLEQAAELSRQYTPTLGTRSLDVLHVASALALGMRQFVTYDERQARLAGACGLKMVRP
jgi:predicted nucleic acid-binding protein